MGNKLLNYLLLGIVSLCVFSPTVTGETVPPSSDCIVYGFFEQPQHSSYLASNSYHFGDTLSLVSTCEVQVWHNQNPPITFTNFTKISMGEGVHSLTLTYDNFTRTYDNLIVITSTNLSIMLDQNGLLKYDSDSLHFSQTSYQSDLAVNGIISGLITWAIVTYGLWFIINKYQSRFLFEEVVQ